MIEFSRRAGGPKTLEDRNIFDMMIQRGSGEIRLGLDDEQYDKLTRGMKGKVKRHDKYPDSPTRCEG